MDDGSISSACDPFQPTPISRLFILDEICLYFPHNLTFKQLSMRLNAFSDEMKNPIETAQWQSQTVLCLGFYLYKNEI